MPSRIYARGWIIGVSGWRAMCFWVESHVFRGGKPWASWWKAMCFMAESHGFRGETELCLCLRSYLFVSAQLPVRVRAATCSCLRSYQLKFAWRYTCCSATAYFRGRECALAEPHVYAPSVWPFSFLHFFIMPFISPYLFFRPPFIRHSVIFWLKPLKYNEMRLEKGWWMQKYPSAFFDITDWMTVFWRWLMDNAGCWRMMDADG